EPQRAERAACGRVGGAELDLRLRQALRDANRPADLLPRQQRHQLRFGVAGVAVRSLADDARTRTGPDDRLDAYERAGAAEARVEARIDHGLHADDVAGEPVAAIAERDPAGRL